MMMMTMTMTMTTTTSGYISLHPVQLHDAVLSTIVPSFASVMHKLCYLKSERCHSALWVRASLVISVFLYYAYMWIDEHWKRTFNRIYFSATAAGYVTPNSNIYVVWFMDTLRRCISSIEWVALAVKLQTCTGKMLDLKFGWATGRPVWEFSAFCQCLQAISGVIL
jgi:hypothetical protein